MNFINWIKWAIGFISPKWVYGIIGMASLAGVVAWFNTYYEPAGKSESLEKEIVRLEDELERSKESTNYYINKRLEEVTDLNNLLHNWQQKYVTLNRHFDVIADEWRKVDAQVNNECRDSAVPKPVIDSLRSAASDTD